jgi:hypothetical protein
MYSVHQDVKFDDHSLLRAARNLNVKRLRSGLETIGEPQPQRVLLQGSMALRTVTRRELSDFDVDIAVVFSAKDLPRTALGARNLVWSAISSAVPSTFRNPPVRRRNAVTVWYADGYHVDFAIYRNLGGGAIEHAGVGWMPVEPGGLRDWFTRQVRTKSPAYRRGSMQGGQWRRMVRLVKWAFEAEDEEYPGGYHLTVLVCECYCPSARGDHLALRWTLLAMEERLDSDLNLQDPVTGIEAVTRPKDRPG